MRQANQGGSVLGFVVIGGILALLLIGGVYFVRQRTERPTQPDTTSAPAPEENTTPEKEQSHSSHQPEKTPSDEQKTQSHEKKDDTSHDEKPATELPQTGPGEATATGVILGLLVAATLSYVRSRRQLASL